MNNDEYNNGNCNSFNYFSIFYISGIHKRVGRIVYSLASTDLWDSCSEPTQNRIEVNNERRCSSGSYRGCHCNVTGAEILTHFKGYNKNGKRDKQEKFFSLGHFLYHTWAFSIFLFSAHSFMMAGEAAADFSRRLAYHFKGL